MEKNKQIDEIKIKKQKIEAILFATGRFCELDELIKHIPVKDKRELKKLLDELKKEYEDRDSALSIIEQDREYKMVVKDLFLEDVRNVLSSMDLSKAVLETLAVVAWKKSMLQSDVIKIRGSSAYEHIKELEDLDFITSVKEGVSKKLTITQKFYDYFNLGGEELTNKMRREQQEKLKQLEEEVKRRQEEEDRLKEEERLRRIEERRAEIEKKKKEMGISTGQTTLENVDDNLIIKTKTNLPQEESQANNEESSDAENKEVAEENNENKEE